MEVQVSNIANSINTTKFNISSKESVMKSDEKFSEKFEDASKSVNSQNVDNSKDINSNESVESTSVVNNTTSELKDLATDSQDEITTVEENLTDKESKLDNKVSDLILALFQGKIDYNQFQMEINKLPISDSKKSQLFDVVSTIIKSEAFADMKSGVFADMKSGIFADMKSGIFADMKSGIFNTSNILTNESVTSSNNTGINKSQDSILNSLVSLMEKEKSTSNEKLKSLNDVLKNVTEALTTVSDDKKNFSKVDLIQKLQSMVKNLSENIDDYISSGSSNIKDQSIDALLSARSIATKGNPSESIDTSKKSSANIEDILTSLTQKKSDKKDTAMLKINGLINSLNNSNGNVSNTSVGQVTDEPMVINKNNVVDDVIKSIKFMDTNKIKELTVKINPKELGEVVIKLVAEGNSMRASIHATKKEAYNLLNSQLNEITKNLQDIKVQGISVSISQEDTTFFANQFNDRSQDRQQSNKKNVSTAINNAGIDTVEEDSPIINSNINALA